MVKFNKNSTTKDSIEKNKKLRERKKRSRWARKKIIGLYKKS